MIIAEVNERSQDHLGIKLDTEKVVFEVNERRAKVANG